ncbi:hypothetical protein PAHAL_9G158500 [Panicum hallii]|jgi:hypothetical protein|uniref:Uncharacterized protein n=1 Tax=Panicum hallii TaxID=206008 RepID=A0A2T8I1D3_9POAL|nr:hypothetical protein PAHAL_9G158500 [Panicum hallii]
MCHASTAIPSQIILISIKYQMKKKESIYTPYLILAAPIFMETTYWQKLIKLD